MGVFDFLKKASAASRLLVVNPGQPRWTPRNYAHFAKEAYSYNVIAYRSINRIADAICSVEWEYWQGDKQIEGDNPLKVLWERPNTYQGNAEYLTAAISYLLIAGNSYSEAIAGTRQRGPIVELHALRSDRMKVVPDAEGLVSRFVYQHNGNSVTWDVDPLTGKGPILHMKMFNPLDDYYGMSPVEAGAFSIDQHNESMKWTQGLLQNSARPSGALVTSDTTLGDEQYARLQAQIEEQYSGSANAGRPMLLENGLDWKQMGLSPTDMGILETKYSSARDVALAFGVPPQLLGIPGDNTYANYKEARLAFYEDTVLPLLSFILGSYNNWFEEPFGGLEVKPNLDSIPAIADKRQELWASIDKSTELTIDERREAKGYPPLATVVPGEDGNRLMAPTPSDPAEEDDPAEEGDEDAQKQAKLVAKYLAYGE
jgi:HK97 family phage portal protein